MRDGHPTMIRHASSPSPHGEPRLTPRAVIVQIAAIWILSDLGYYLLLPALGVELSYNTGPMAISLYYLYWTGVAIIAFWPLYARWVRFDDRIASYAVWTLAFGGGIWFVAAVMPALPATDWSQPWTPPDVRLATEWYFLPKSIDILFQQLLVAALVLALAADGASLRRTSLLTAAIFGGAHVLLALGGAPVGYVIRFVVSATLFGLVFPTLILRVPNGLAFAYIVHWLYYAVTASMARIMDEGLFARLFGGS